ncbi:MAG: ATP-binding protein, partial [Pseudomonadales bacterium]|nr:ATP-binding protein [Pseudomonadales bacterium]
NFVYDIKLIPTNETSDSEIIVENLKQGKFAYLDDDDVSVLARQVSGSDLSIYMYLDIGEDLDTINSARGPLTLLRDELLTLERVQWDTRLAALEQEFAFPLTLEPLDGLKLSERKLQQLQQKGITYELSEERYTILYIPLTEQEVLKAGPAPMPGSIEKALIAIFSMVIGALSIGMILFLYPLWRDLNKLAGTASSFGEGYLDRRAELGKRSIVIRLATSFNAMADRIENMIKSQRDLTNAIAHDLRTPLSRLSFAFEMLDHDDVSEEDRRRYSRSIGTSIDTLDHLIQQILALSRYSRAADVAQFSHSKLALALQDATELTQAAYPKLNIGCDISPELHTETVFSDRRAILRALDNLLGNAVRFAKSTIEIDFVTTETHYCLRVSDDGPGIPEQDYEKVFLPFSQLGNAQREISKEHGLGLAIVKQIALWHRGTIQLKRSNLGGAQFELCWPRVQEHKVP